MIPTTQTIFQPEGSDEAQGNCLSAVLASLLHLPIDDVPLFVNPDTWIMDLNQWLRQYGLAYLQLENFATACASSGIQGCHHEQFGHCDRSNTVLHACVGVDGFVRFDPHPSGTGLIGETASGVFIALQPWLMVDRKVRQGVTDGAMTPNKARALIGMPALEELRGRVDMGQRIVTGTIRSNNWNEAEQRIEFNAADLQHVGAVGVLGIGAGSIVSTSFDGSCTVLSPEGRVLFQQDAEGNATITGALSCGPHPDEPDLCAHCGQAPCDGSDIGNCA
jgi:hypothetical protein